MSSDIRIYNMRILNSISVFDGMQLFYPKMYPLFDLPVEVYTYLFSIILFIYRLVQYLKSPEPLFYLVL